MNILRTLANTFEAQQRSALRDWWALKTLTPVEKGVRMCARANNYFSDFLEKGEEEEKNNLKNQFGEKNGGGGCSSFKCQPSN